MRTKTDAKRQEILAAASALFHEHGVASVTMADVCEAVGASKATLYRYFPSKTELVIASLLEGAIDRAARIFESLDPEADLEAELTRFGSEYLALALADETIRSRRSLIAEGARLGLGQTFFEAGPHPTWGIMADFLGARMTEGRLARATPWTAAMHLRGLLEADVINRALLGAKVDRSKAKLQALAADSVRVFLRAYRP